MVSLADLVSSVRVAPEGMTLAEVLARHPDLTRRTAQRRLQEGVASGQLVATGKGPSRRYFEAASLSAKQGPVLGTRPEARPTPTPLSADSVDVWSYVDQPLEARKPVGYQQEFLRDYIPNQTAYLPGPLRRQLQRMGKTAEAAAPAGTYSRAILNRLLIDLSWASSHLEGNTYSRLDTRALIQEGRIAHGKAARETQMILNHKAAIELLVDRAQEHTPSAAFNRYTLMNLHSVLAENLLPNPADEGRIRRHAVDIAQSVYRPLSTPPQVEEAFDLMLTKLNQIEDPFEQSFFVMVHLPYLQPFADVNKRVSRLAANLPMFRANLCPLTFVDVPQDTYSRAMLGVYEMTRVELLRDLYVWAYERSTQEYIALRQQLAEPDPLRLAYRAVIKQAVHDVVIQPERDTMTMVEQWMKDRVPDQDRANVQALVIEELRRLHEGVLARYGLRPSQFAAWRDRRDS